jgi:hypothetical protein
MTKMMTIYADAVDERSNDDLKSRFQSLHDQMVNRLDAAPLIDYLFSQRVISSRDFYELNLIFDQKLRCRSLLALLHVSRHPRAFIHLWQAIRGDEQLKWLTELFDSPGELSFFTYL